MGVRSSSLQSMKLAKPMFAQPPRVLLPGPEPKFIVTRSGEGAMSRRNELLTFQALPKRSSDSSFAQLGSSGVIDVRDSLRRFSSSDKCMYVDSHASLCGNLVV